MQFRKGARLEGILSLRNTERRPVVPELQLRISYVIYPQIISTTKTRNSRFFCKLASLITNTVKTFLLITLNTIILSVAWSQDEDIDKLWKNFRHGSSAQRVKACDELTRYYHSEARDTLRVLGEELFLFGIDEHYYPAIEQGKLTLADYFILSGKTADGISMAKALLSNMEERGDDHMISLTAGTISLGYILQKDANSAYYWAKRAARAGANNADPIVKAESWMTLAESYYLLHQTEKAVETYQQYITIIKPYKKYRSISSAYARLGDMYRLEGNMALATRFFQYSMDNARKSGKTIVLAHALNNMAIVYFEEGDTVKARESFEEAMKLRLKINDPKAISESYYNMGDYHYFIGKYDIASEWYSKSLRFAKDNNLRAEHADALRALAEVSKSTGDYKGATENLELYITLQKQIDVANSSDDEEIADLQRTIMRLETENDIKNGGFGMKRANGNFKWEWLVIAFLGTALVLSLIMKRKTAG